ncbi:MAG: hypothetical protein WC602_03130 [archaeon]
MNEFETIIEKLDEITQVLKQKNRRKIYYVLPNLFRDEEIDTWRGKIADPDFVENFPVEAETYQTLVCKYDDGLILRKRGGFYFVVDVGEYPHVRDWKQIREGVKKYGKN